MLLFANPQILDREGIRKNHRGSYALPARWSWPGLSRPSHLGGHSRASLSGMRGSSSRMTIGVYSSELMSRVLIAGRERRWRNRRARARGWNNISSRHVGLMFATLTTLPHFSVSSARNVPNSEADPV